MKKKFLTLCYIIKEGQVLLGYKKKGFGEGKWNGFGGKAEPGETIDETAIREIKEECGIKINNIIKAGIIEFKYLTYPDEIMEVHIFRAEDFSGEPEESEEMIPRWFKFEEIPFDKTWDDDQYWLLEFLKSNKKVKASFLFNEQFKVIEKEVLLLD